MELSLLGAKVRVNESSGYRCSCVDSKLVVLDWRWTKTDL